MISVVMTVYGVEPFVEKAVKSVLNSTYKDIELIIVNDCTQDKSMEIINSISDSRIKIINHEINQGAGMARRTGIKASTGDYIITIDADDWISEDFLEALWNRAQETDADIVGAGITYAFKDKNKEIKYEKGISEGIQKFRDYNNGKIIFLNNKLVRRKLYDSVEYCGRRYCEDTPTIIPLMYLANKIAYIDNCGYFYAMRDNSLTHTLNPLKENLYKALCCIDCIEFLKDKELEYRNIIPVSQLMSFVKPLKELHLTKKDIEPYKEEFLELQLYIFNNLINIQ